MFLVCTIFQITPACAQSFSVGFPVAGQNPYTAPIISVLDHSSIVFYDKAHTQVVAYTGEMGQDKVGPSGCGLSGQPCGYYNPKSAQFFANGKYVGYFGDAPDANKVLNYRGHSGYDYNYGLGTNIIAANDGDLYVPAYDPVNNPGYVDSTHPPVWNDPWCDYHTFYIKDPNSGWTTWYLHASALTVGPPGQPHTCTVGTNGLSSNITADQLIARGVHKGDPVAIVGNWACGMAGGCGIGYHLHFEVRRSCDIPTGVAKGCMVVDPYGWEWNSGDPITQNPSKAILCRSRNVLGQSVCATSQAAPLWDAGLNPPVASNISLVGSPGSYTATIAGQNFDPGALVTLWSRQGQYLVTTITPSSPPTATQIIAQIPNSFVSDPGQFVLKVQNPQGPRSSGTVLSLPVGTSSAPLLLAGQPAPGGGTFAGFNGFWSFTNRGDFVFGAGIDTTGSGTPSSFADFISSAGQKTKVSVPGFSNISSTASHVRMNNRGDLAFGDINGVYGGLPAGIYVLNAGSSAPTAVVTWGQACPAPCPVAGSPTVYQLNGPLAFSDAGDVAFAASLLNQQTNTATCCFLFVYSGRDGAIVKVAADGPAGDATPVQGTFAPGTLLSPITQFTSGGDVVFLAQVSGGASSGGIFRFNRTSGLSKLVAQGDDAPSSIGGKLGYPLFGRTGSISGKQLVFHAPITGGSANQIIGVVDATITSPPVTAVAYQGEATGTSAGGFFSSSFNSSQLPFGYFGQNTAPPCIRSDGAVVFHSLLSQAQASTGASTTQGVFLWNGLKFQKIVVDGDQVSSGLGIQGVFAPVINDIGEVLYFVASLQ